VSKQPKSKSGGNASGGAEGPSFEDALSQIESIIERIESGEIGLEQSLAEYEKGVSLINLCRVRLDKAQQQVEDLTRRLASADEGGPGEGDDADEEESDLEP
jgi:exodeoxyribonuclease VII small subunit